jgi:hypothetical protein
VCCGVFRDLLSGSSVFLSDTIPTTYRRTLGGDSGYTAYRSKVRLAWDMRCSDAGSIGIENG